MALVSLRSKPAPRPAGYYASDRDLYRVERLFSDHALLEDCRTGDLIDVPVSYMRRLRPVRRGRPSAS